MVIRKFAIKKHNNRGHGPVKSEKSQELEVKKQKPEINKRRKVLDPFDDDYIGEGPDIGLVNDDDDDDLKLPTRRFDSSKIDKVKRAKLDFESTLDQQLKKTEASIEEHKKLTEAKEAKVAKDEETLAEGKKKGYPTEMDEEAVLKIMDDNFLDKMRKILKGESPSKNYDDTKKYAKSSSKHYISSGELIVNKQIPGMGYYGNKGREIIGFKLMKFTPEIRKLQKKKENSWMLKFDDSTLLELLLYQEAMVLILMNEKTVDYKSAKQILDESSAYGDLYFS